MLKFSGLLLHGKQLFHSLKPAMVAPKLFVAFEMMHIMENEAYWPSMGAFATDISLLTLI